jgi:competence protein ComEC
MKTPASPAPNRFEDLLTRLPLTWVALAFLGGIVLASRVTLAWWIWLSAAGVALIIALVLRLLLPRFSIILPSYFFLLTLSLLGLCLGAARYQATVPTVDAFTLAWYNDREYDLLLTGTVDAPPDVRDTYTNLRVRVSAVDTGKGDLSVSGLVLARVDNDATWRYGDVIRLRGKMTTPPEDEEFSYRDYLARQGILSYMTNAAVTRLPFARAGNPLLRLVYDSKDRALANIYKIFPDPEASLLAGILLGEDNGLPADLQQAFKNTGTAHIIAISGFNIAIIAGLFVTLFSRLLGPRRGAVAAVIGIFVYTILVGASASVVRAAIMGTFAIFARQVGRRQTALNTLTATAAVMAVVNPYTPWDVGFQLSFFATLGLVLYAGPFQEWAVRIISRFSLPETAEKIAKPISEYVLFTLAAQLTTLPIMAWHFGRISLVSIIANPFILPAQPPVMILGGLAVLVSFIYLPLGQIFAWIAWPFIAYTIRAVELFDSLPHGVIILGDFSPLLVFLFYAVLFGWTFSQGRVKQALRAALTPAAILVTLGVLAFLTWSAAFTAPDGNLHVTFLDVGSADAVLIQTPGGGNILVNGGASPSVLSDALGRRLPPTDRHLDWLILASTQEGQVAALPRTLERVPPGDVLWAGNIEASYSSAALDRWLADRSVPVTRAEPGMALDLGAGARLTVQTVTTRGAILLVEWDGFRLLLPIGQNFDSLDASDYGANIGPVTVLLLGDSGLATVNPSKWIANLRPQVVILSVAAGDLSGLPSEAVLKSIRNATLLRTDRDGWIEVSTDGKRMWVNVQKK